MGKTNYWLIPCSLSTQVWSFFFSFIKLSLDIDGYLTLLLTVYNFLFKILLMNEPEIDFRFGQVVVTHLVTWLSKWYLFLVSVTFHLKSLQVCGFHQWSPVPPTHGRVETCFHSDKIVLLVIFIWLLITHGIKVKPSLALPALWVLIWPCF